MTAWDDLTRALDARAKAGNPARFWLRDDDAVAPTPALDQLLNLSTRHDVALTLAVIPAETGAELAEHLTDAQTLSVAVHGWAHSNHASAGEKSQELGHHRPSGAVLHELTQGFAHLAGLYPQQFVPLLVPPWNRIAPQVVAGLPPIGFQALSAYGAARPAALPMINTHVDLIDWRDTRGGRPTPALLSEITDHLRASDLPLGILTHHLVHDAAVWAFLEQLFALTSDHPGCDWVSVTELIPAP